MLLVCPRHRLRAPALAARQESRTARSADAGAASTPAVARQRGAREPRRREARVARRGARHAAARALRFVSGPRGRAAPAAGADFAEARLPANFDIEFGDGHLADIGIAYDYKMLYWGD